MQKGEEYSIEAENKKSREGEHSQKKEEKSESKKEEEIQEEKERRKSSFSLDDLSFDWDTFGADDEKAAGITPVAGPQGKKKAKKLEKSLSDDWNLSDFDLG